jgi:gamma-glutamylputrescine oxidase
MNVRPSLQGLSSSEPTQHPPSAWAATAHPPPQLPSLDQDIETDVAIIGGGYTGLSTAHHLCKAGIDCVVLEANDAGWGASGRNGGMAVLRYKKPYSVLAAEYGSETTRRMYALVHEAVDTLEAIVDEYRIDCAFRRCGHITAANGRAAMATLQADLRWLETEAGDKTPTLLGAEEMRSLVGTTVYPGGYLDPRAAGIHPLNYARGLAAGLSHRGVPIYVATPAHGIQSDASGMTVQTPRGRVRAKQVVVATNAYTDLAQLNTDLHRRIVPVSTSVIATAPLPPEMAVAILGKRHLVTDTRHLVNYFRMLANNRLLYGGRGDVTGYEAPEIYRGLEKLIVATFPSLAAVPVEFRWSGQVAVTLDDFPHLGRIGERIFYAMGYGGRGVALSHLLGKLLARMVQGEAVEAGPMSHNRFKPVPLHRWRVPVIKVVAGYYKLRDRLAR